MTVQQFIGKLEPIVAHELGQGKEAFAGVPCVWSVSPLPRQTFAENLAFHHLSANHVWFNWCSRVLNFDQPRSSMHQDLP
jgi:hypothetical protein